MRPSTTRARVRSGGVAVGTMLFEWRSPAVAAITAAAGSDFIVVDQEATGAATESVATVVAGGRGLDIDVLVRIPAAVPHLVTSALDAGVAGVMVPAVDGAATARTIVDAAKYPPLGHRGVITGLAASDYRPVSDLPAVLHDANRESFVIAQVETVAGLDAVEEIAAVDGVDALWLGPLDLSVSLGLPGDYDHPDFHAAVQRIAHAAHATGSIAAAKVGSIAEGVERIAQGYGMVAYLDDVRLIRDGLRAGLDVLRGASRFASHDRPAPHVSHPPCS